MVGKRRITKSTLSIVTGPVSADVQMLPIGAIIEIPKAPIEGNRTIDVIWNGQKVMMFVSDLMDRTQEIRAVPQPDLAVSG